MKDDKAQKTTQTPAADKGQAKKTVAVKWNPLYFWIMARGSALLRKFLNAHVHMSESFKRAKKDEAMLVVCNHTSSFDFAYFIAPFYPEKVNFVVAEGMKLSRKSFAKLLNGYHVIQKKQFFSDLNCIKNIKRYLDAGISVVICPEGKVTSDGKTGVILPSIARLVKWLGHPVASVVTHGGGIVWPKWSTKVRRARVEIDCDMLFDAEEVKSLGKDEICVKINARLANNEYVWQIENGVECKSRSRAQGLENLLYKCPVCGAEFAMLSNGNVISCQKCGATATLTPFGELKSDSVPIPNRVDLWSDMQRDAVKNEVALPDFALEDDVALYVSNKDVNGYDFVSVGHLKLDSNALVWTSFNAVRPIKNVKLADAEKMKNKRLDNAKCEPIDTKLLRLEFSMEACSTLANIPGLSIDMSDEEHLYRFVFLGRKASAKYAYAVEELAAQN